MVERVEGSFALDGLIEGRIPPGSDASDRLREWVEAVRMLGLEVQLETDGAAFSLLAGSARIRAHDVGGAPAHRVRELVEQLVAVFPDPGAAQLFSTLRSVEVRPGAEIQTVFVIRPDGSVDAPERAIDVATTPPRAPRAARDWVKVGGLSIVLVAALFGITSLFVDWGGAAESLWNKVVPFDADEVVVHSEFERFFQVAKRERGPGGKTLLLTLERTAAFPQDGMAVLLARENTTRIGTVRRLALDALARGYVRVEIFAEDGAFLGFRDLRIAGLRDEPRIVAEIPVPRDPRPAEIRFVP